MSELIKKLAKEHGIELKLIKFTDKDGRFPSHIGGFKYDKKQLSQLEAMCKAYAEATREQDTKDAEWLRKFDELLDAVFNAPNKGE